MIDRLTDILSGSAVLGMVVALAAMAFAALTTTTLPGEADAQVIDFTRGPCFVGCCPSGPPPCLFDSPGEALQ